MCVQSLVNDCLIHQMIGGYTVMSIYHIGEVARMCGTTVRTIQFYDQQGIVCAKSHDNGKRQYGEAEIAKLKQVILFKSLGFHLKDIKRFIKGETHRETLALLLQRKKEEVEQTIAQQTAQLEQIKWMEKHMEGRADAASFEFKEVDRVSQAMQHVDDMKRFRRKLLLIIGGVGLIQYGGIIKALVTREMIPIWQTMPFVFVGAVVITYQYLKHVAYICPNCHHVFKPAVKSILHARHTPSTRKLKCPSCNETSYCMEVYDSENK